MKHFAHLALFACLAMSAPTVQGHAPDVEAVTVNADTATNDAFAQLSGYSTQVLTYAGCCDQGYTVKQAVATAGCCDQGYTVRTSAFTKAMVGIAALAALAFVHVKLRNPRTRWTLRH